MNGQVVGAEQIKDMMNPLTQLPVTDEQLAYVVKLAEKQRDMEIKYKFLEDSLRDLAKHIKLISSETLPDAMAEIGLVDFKLSDGTQVEVRPFYSGKIPSEDEVEKDPSLGQRRHDAFQWLRDNGHAELIKRNLTLKFDAGKDAVAEALKAKLLEMGHIPEDRTNVHHQTLKAFIREMTERAQPLPTDLLGVYVGKVTKITPANNV